MVFGDKKTKKDIIGSLMKANFETEGHVPRKDDRKVLEFEVECTGLYGILKLEGMGPVEQFPRKKQPSSWQQMTRPRRWQCSPQLYPQDNKYPKIRMQPC